MIPPLVTVGVPTFNRPYGLRRTLSSIAAQTWANLEIIVSDNASTNPAVQSVINDAMVGDDRIRVRRHPTNVGAMPNFTSLIREGSGDFFMWAADDDRWSPFFIEHCMTELLKRPNLALCQMEAQYELASGELFPFFREGGEFYLEPADSPASRVRHVLQFAYGNLVYGVFRRSALFHRGKPVTDWVGATVNEFPMLVLMAANGGIQVLPDVGMYKQAPVAVCEQARWEQLGGKLPGWTGLRAHIGALGSIWRYHETVADETDRSIVDLGFDAASTSALQSLLRSVLRRHAMSLALRWKPATKSNRSKRLSNPTILSEGR